MRARILETTTAATTTNTPSVDLKYCDSLSVQAVASAVNATAGAFTAAVTDICTKTAHGFLTGLKVQVSSATTLPAGLSGSTDYFVIKIDADTFYLSDTYAHAVAGTNKINITDTGTGIHTITPTPIAGCTVKVQVSNDNTNFDDLPSATANVTAIGSVSIPCADSSYRHRWARAVLTLTAGQPAIVIIASGRERRNS